MTESGPEPRHHIEAMDDVPPEPGDGPYGLYAITCNEDGSFVVVADGARLTVTESGVEQAGGTDSSVEAFDAVRWLLASCELADLHLALSRGWRLEPLVFLMRCDVGLVGEPAMRRIAGWSIEWAAWLEELASDDFAVRWASAGRTPEQYQDERSQDLDDPWEAEIAAEDVEAGGAWAEWNMAPSDYQYWRSLGIDHQLVLEANILGDEGFDDDEVKTWLKLTGSSDNAIRWRDEIGDLTQVRDFIDAGFDPDDPDCAYSWHAAGFTAVEARALLSAGHEDPDSVNDVLGEEHDVEAFLQRMWEAGEPDSR